MATTSIQTPSLTTQIPPSDQTPARDERVDTGRRRPRQRGRGGNRGGAAAAGNINEERNRALFHGRGRGGGPGGRGRGAPGLGRGRGRGGPANISRTVAGAGAGRSFGGQLTRDEPETADSVGGDGSVVQDQTTVDHGSLRADAPAFVPGQPVQSAQGSAVQRSAPPPSTPARTRTRQPKPVRPTTKSTAHDIATRTHEDIAHNLNGQVMKARPWLGHDNRKAMKTERTTPVNGGVPDAICPTTFSRRYIPAGAGKNRIRVHFPASLPIHVDRRAQRPGKDVLILVIPCAMRVLVRRVRRWVRRSPAFAGAMSQRKDVLILIMRTDGAVESPAKSCSRVLNTNAPAPVMRDFVGRVNKKSMHVAIAEKTPCQSLITTTCPCGRLKQEKRCNASRDKIRAPQSPTPLKCDEECGRLERNRTLASALNVSIDPQTTSAANPSTQTASTLPYSEETLDLYLKLSTSSTLSTLQTYQSTLHSLATSQTQRSARFPPARSQLRAFIHSLAADWGFKSESFDPEPHRHVLVFKSASWLPPQLGAAIPGSLGVGIGGLTVGDCAKMRDRERMREREAKRLAAAAAEKLKAENQGQYGAGDSDAAAGGGGWAQVASRKRATGPAESPFGFGDLSSMSGKAGTLVLRSGVGKGRGAASGSGVGGGRYPPGFGDDVVDDWEEEVEKEEREREREQGQEQRVEDDGVESKVDDAVVAEVAVENQEEQV
ncbi:hypothetical protein FQN50_005331 [Emmonsiellopsis sp. PD_5]|nr:hypothetical protein FQN50_005331 [Emmonsiellopsis sp. PD_5]